MIVVTKNRELITLDLEIYLINRSATKGINLFILANAIKKQLEDVYSKPTTPFQLKLNVTVKPLYNYKFRQILNKLIICVSDHVTNDNVAEADFGGLLVKLNPKHIPSVISGANKRTLPHELGHILGLEHPHANAKFESVNIAASLPEQEISNEEKTHNLMCQSWYIQKAGVKLNDALSLTETQVNLIYDNYISKKLNQNYSLRPTFFSYKWIGNV